MENSIIQKNIVYFNTRPLFEELLERSQKLKVFGFKIIFFTVQKLLQIDYVRLNIQYLLK